MENKNHVLRIREVLQEKGYTPQLLAEEMKVSRQYVNNILSERHSVSIKTLQRIADILGVPVSTLFADYENAVHS